MTERASFWDREVQTPIHVGWMTPEPVRFYVNERISGDRHRWPLDWLQRRDARRFEHALSIGCGTGALERDLVARDIVGSVDAFDGSIASVAVARREASAAGMSPRIRYYAADFNRPSLRRGLYDAVFMHQSLHHVEKLERLLAAILMTLKPGGLFYLDEYIGPSRTFWNERTVAPYREQFRAIPRPLRRMDELPLPVQPDDPTEAFRSGEIVEQLAVGFRTEEFRGYGGAVLSVIGVWLELESMPRDDLQRLIEADRAREDFYAVIVARPKSGASRTFARVRYFTEPKLKRIGREFRRLASPQQKR